MDNDFKDINNILYLLDEDVISSMNATEDLFNAGKSISVLT